MFYRNLSPIGVYFNITFFESNISGFWQPRGADPLEYAKLIKLTADEIRAVIPDALIGACLSGGAFWWNNSYVLKLLRSGIARELNFFCVHAYGTQPEQNYRQCIAMLRRVLDAADKRYLLIDSTKIGRKGLYRIWARGGFSAIITASKNNVNIGQSPKRTYGVGCGSTGTKAVSS